MRSLASPLIDDRAITVHTTKAALDPYGITGPLLATKYVKD